ncbi:hypothetical protein FOA52_002484 [Chlamydomonas sp. UWO 241]|nr:hypothetical protein FOA52_002484 [Chlamydomonas sp. UWO 241]
MQARVHLSGGGPPAVGRLELWRRWWHVESPQEALDEGNAPSDVGPILRKMGALIAPDKWLMAGAACFMVVAALSELAIPHYFTKSIFAAGAKEAAATHFSEYIRLLGGIVLVFGLSTAVRGYCFSILNNRLTMRLRQQLFSNLVLRETSFFDTTEVGTLTSRLQTDCHAITGVISTNINVLTRNALQAIGGFVYLATLSQELATCCLFTVSILAAVTLTYGKFARRNQKVYQDVLACSNRVADEVLSLSRIVRTFGAEAQEKARYSTWLEWLYQVAQRRAGGYSLFLASSYIVSYGTKVVALVLGCRMVAQGTLTPEQLTTFVLYLQFVVSSSLTVCDEFTEVMEALGASERVMALLDGAPAPQVGRGKMPLNFGGVLELRNVNFRYPSRPNASALLGVSIRLEPGKQIALVGKSGSGKSSAVALLQRLYDPSSGIVTLDGADIRVVDAGWYRRNIGVVSQDTRLFGATVAANIAYGYDGALTATLSSDRNGGDGGATSGGVASSLIERTEVPIRASQEEIEEAARAASAHDFIMALPQGYQTQVSDKLLSGGQKQRIALARALIRKPNILILDEATSALDSESEAQVQDALDAAMASSSGRTRSVVMVAHRLATVRNADTIYVMDAGMVAEAGRHSELMEARGLYWHLVMRQVHGVTEDQAIQDSLDAEQLGATGSHVLV